jgi:hypothetical protein
MQVAAVIAVVLLTLVAIFQAALAVGAPLGEAAWGGQHSGVLPTRLRVASGVAAVLIYPGIAATVLNAAGVIHVEWLPAGAGIMWLLTGFFALGTVANLASRSRPECIWAPVSAAIAVCCAVIARGV